MKTKLVRPVLVPVDKSFLYLHGGKLYNNRTTMHIPDGKQQPQQLILISLEDEKIEVGDRVIYDFFDGHIADVIVDNTGLIKSLILEEKKGKIFSREEYELDWSQIAKIGDDIILAKDKV